MKTFRDVVLNIMTLLTGMLAGMTIRLYTDGDYRSATIYTLVTLTALVFILVQQHDERKKTTTRIVRN